MTRYCKSECIREEIVIQEHTGTVSWPRAGCACCDMVERIDNYPEYYNFKEFIWTLGLANFCVALSWELLQVIYFPIVLLSKLQLTQSFNAFATKLSNM